VWLNDNRRLVFPSDGKLFLLDSETGDVQELFAPPLGYADYPTVSRDNRTLYFTFRNMEADIWLLELN
jgi:hypothetical protein